MNKIEQINLLIGNRKDLISEYLYQRSVSSVKEILELPYWNDKKFEPLLTSSIWLRNAEEIETILELPYWNDPKYQSLLTSSIWQSNASEIQRNLRVAILE